MIRALALLALLSACADPGAKDPADDTDTSDLDDDGFTVEAGDCNDNDPDIYPGVADPPYDRVDQNCSGGSDNDVDGDGFDAESTGGDDCDDTNDQTYPGAPDEPYDGENSDCAPGTDFDADGDGHDAAAYGGDDCDDADADISPSAPETWYDGVDADCAGDDDFDQDADGHRAADHGGDDCDDQRGDVYPGAPETWYDGLDADCLGDDDFDQDADGHSAAEHGGDDCDDTRADVHPGAVDPPYDGLDADCGGGDDDDLDGDGFAGQPAGGDDCDDTRDDVFPGAPETWYDGLDADCADDDDFDQDGDGYVAQAHGGDDCDDTRDDVFPGAPDAWYDGLDADCADNDDFDQDADGYTSDDCDDTRPDVFPGAPDAWYDGLDADCAGNDDFDQDADGHVAQAHGGDDCLDTDADVSPSDPERCNDVDDDCDDDVDEADAIDAPTWYVDLDGDGYGTTPVVACDQPADGAPDAGDCDDDDGATFPGAPPVACDGAENDCDDAVLEVGGGFRVQGAPYPTLSAAIGAAAGGTVEVCEGRHVLALTLVTQGVTLWGPAGRARTVLDGEGLSGLFDVRTTAPVVLEGLTLTGGDGVRGAGTHRGGAMRLGDGAEVTLRDCLVVDNRAGDGAGLYGGEDVTLRLVRTDVADNRGVNDVAPVSQGGGVTLADGGLLVLDDSAVRGNDADACGGVRFVGEGSLQGAGAARVHDNRADLAGGGVCASVDAVSLSGLRVDHNDAATGAGVDGWDLTLTDVELDHNVATLTGGGVRAQDELVLIRVDVHDNEAGIDGGGVELGIGGDATLDTCVVTGNEVDFTFAAAGGVRVDGGTLTSINTDWGANPRNNPPGDIGLVFDALTFNYTGTHSFVCDDGSGLGCQ